VKQELARLRGLAARVGAGDRTATAHLLRQLAPRMRRIVRRVMRQRSSTSPLATRILREARQVTAASRSVPDRERLIRAVARNLCATLVEQLRGRRDCWPVLRDTILA
jgi:hypothetical protein